MEQMPEKAKEYERKTTKITDRIAELMKEGIKTQVTTGIGMKGGKEWKAETADKFIDNLLKKDKEKTFTDIAELIKTKKISQIILHSKESKDPGEEKGLTMKPDLDARGALLILDLIEKELGNVYKEEAVTSFIPKSGTKKDLTLNKDGLRLFIDSGQSWLGVETTNGNINANLDHHGSGKGEQTSASEMMYEIYKIIKKDSHKNEEPAWLKNFVKLANEVDNLSYIDEINKKEKGTGGFDKKYFTEKWPNSLYAVAEKIPFEVLQDLFESGKVKDSSHIFTKGELEGEIGKIKAGEKTIAEWCAEQQKRAGEAIRGVEKANERAIDRNLNLLNTPLGKTILYEKSKDIYIYTMI